MSRFMSNLKQTLFDRFYPLKPFSEKKPFRSYREELSNQSFSVYSPKKEKIIAAYQNTLCTQLIAQKNVFFSIPTQEGIIIAIESFYAKNSSPD